MATLFFDIHFTLFSDSTNPSSNKNNQSNFIFSPTRVDGCVPTAPGTGEVTPLDKLDMEDVGVRSDGVDIPLTLT